MPLIEFKNVSFKYNQKNKPALVDFNLQIRAGDYITVCGKSGSGKSTLLKLFKSVLTPKGDLSGEILYKGNNLKNVPMESQVKELGFVMQDVDNQIVTDKVWHELAFGLESVGMDQNTMRLRVAEMASFFGISDWFYKNVTELSGGQKQLLNLASIMAMQPKVLILDEPTSQLDPIAATDFLNTVKKINLELGTTIIITEHRLEDILYASNKVIVLEEGKTIAMGDPISVGGYLKKQNNPMFYSMPSPMQIFLEVEKERDKDGEIPLTVREGALWINDNFKEKNKKLPESESVSIIKNDNAVFLKEVWLRYKKDDKDVLKGIDVSVPKGVIYAIVGANGSGKSTLLKAILGLIKPYRGKINTKGKVVMLPQNPKALFSKDSVAEELKTSAKEADESKIDKVVKICDLEEMLDSHPFDLSGGEMQRLALAKSVLRKPDILLLDEPTKGMDNFFKNKLYDILSSLKEEGITTIIVSHDIEFCAKYTDLVSMVFDGSIISTNTPREFFSANAFYTTAANRMCREVFPNAVINEEVVSLCKACL